VGKSKGRGPTAQPQAGATTEQPDLSHIAEDLRANAVPIDECSLDPQNANKHGEESIAGIAVMLSEFGQRTPIVINSKTGHIAKGNGTWLAAKRLGWKWIARVRITDDAIRTMAYALGDNRSAELSEWNQIILDEQLAIVHDHMPNLEAGLLLDELKVGTEATDEPELESKPVGDVSYRVIVHVKDEAAQAQLIQRLESEGFECLPLMS
jgi:ParB-like chromosome segregation protein Spo0J